MGDKKWQCKNAKGRRGKTGPAQTAFSPLTQHFSYFFPSFLFLNFFCTFDKSLLTTHQTLAFELISELAKYQPASLQSGCVTVSVNLDPEDDKPCSMGGKYGKYGRWGRKCCIPTPFAMGVYFSKVKQSKKCYLTFYKSEQRITSTSTASTEKEVVRKSFLLMGTGGLRGCMISHSTDANPTIRHQPLHCHNAPLSCTTVHPPLT